MDVRAVDLEGGPAKDESLLKKAWSLARGGARALDQVPATIGGTILTYAVAKKKEAAAKDPTWKAIEDRRGPGGLVLLSEDLSVDDWETQSRIEEANAPHPRLERLGRLIANLRAEKLLQEVEHRAQRAARGWSDQDVWDLHRSHERALGGMLLRLAESSHGWPASKEFPSMDDWTSALTYHGNVLSTHGKHDLTLTDEEKETLRLDAEARGTLSILHAQEEQLLEAKGRERVKVSLHWVAEQNESLWD